MSTEIFGGISLGSRNSASSRKGCVVGGTPPPPFPVPSPIVVSFNSRGFSRFRRRPHASISEGGRCMSVPLSDEGVNRCKAFAWCLWSCGNVQSQHLKQSECAHLLCTAVSSTQPFVRNPMHVYCFFSSRFTSPNELSSEDKNMPGRGRGWKPIFFFATLPFVFASFFSSLYSS